MLLIVNHTTLNPGIIEVLLFGNILINFILLHTFSLSLKQNGCDIHQPVFELLLDIVNHYYNNIVLVQQLYINLRPLLQIEPCK